MNKVALSMLVALLAVPDSSSSQSLPAPLVDNGVDALPVWIGKPPAWITWLSFVGGLGAFGWQLCEHLISRKDRRADRRIAVETFWYESVIVPRVVEPLLNFLDLYSSKFQGTKMPSTASATKDRFRAYLNDYQKDQSSLISQLRLLLVLDKPTHDEIANALDDLDDKITLICYRASEGIKNGKGIDGELSAGLSQFSSVQSQCVEKLKGLHHAVTGLKRT